MPRKRRTANKARPSPHNLMYLGIVIVALLVLVSVVAAGNLLAGKFSDNRNWWTGIGDGDIVNINQGNVIIGTALQSIGPFRALGIVSQSHMTASGDITAFGNLLVRGFTELEAIKINNLAGSGNAYVCVNYEGTLYRSLTPCV